MAWRLFALLAVIFFLCAVGARTALAAGEQVGQIRGRVVEVATDLPVPGATVTASSSNLGDPRVTTTDENGEFLVPNLPIGHYTVTIAYPGVKPITRATLVDPGVTSPLEVKWSAELAQAETTTVIEERPVTNPGSSQTGATISYDLHKNIPGSREFRDLVLQVPGARMGVRSYLINGGRETDNRYLVDGFETTDPIERSAFRQRLSVESIEAQQVITGGFSAEFNSLGGVINTVTKEGSDEWHGSASIYATNSALSGRTPQGVLLTDYDQPFNHQKVATSYNHYDSVRLGGPLIKHRLWFHAALEYRHEHFARLQGPPINYPKAPEDQYYYWPQLKISWVPTPNQRVTTSFIADPSFKSNTNQWNDRLSLYRAHEDEGGYNAIVSWSIFPSKNFEFSVNAGFKTYWHHQGPQGWFGEIDKSYCDVFYPQTCNYDRESPVHVNQDDPWPGPNGTGSKWLNGNFDVDYDHRNNFQIDPKVTIRGRWFGEHAARVGFQLRMLRNHRTLHTPGFYTYDDRNGGPLADGVCDPDGVIHGKTQGCYQRTYRADRKFVNLNYNPGFFFQDEWRLLSWLAIMPGVRFDYGRTVLTSGEVFNSQFAVGPRIGAVLDITRDQKTILSANYGRSNEVAPFTEAANHDAALRGGTRTERWNSGSRGWDPLVTSGGAAGRLIDRNAKVQHADQITASFRREIFLNTVAEVEYTWKKVSNGWATIETNQIWDHTGYRIVGYRDGINHAVNVSTTSDAVVRNYHGINVALQGRPTPNWYFIGKYTLSWLYGTEENSVPAQAKFENGYLNEDERQRVSLATSYTFGFGLIVGMRMAHSSGGPRTATGQEGKKFTGVDGGSRRRSPRGTDPGYCTGDAPGQGNFRPGTTVCGNNLDLVSELRVPATTSLDMQFQYDVYPLLKQHVALSLEVSNILTERTKNGINNTDSVGGGFGTATGSEGAWSTRLGVRYDF